MAYPNTIDAPDTTMQGTTLFTGDDHSLQHRTYGSAIITIENKLGIGAGSAALNQILVGGGVGTATWGTVWTGGSIVTPNIAGGTANTLIIGTPTITGGTYTSGTFGTPAIDVINARNSGTALGFGNSIYPAEGTIVDSAGGTLTVNAQTAQIYYSVMGTTAGNRTIGTPTNPTPYQQLTYAFKSSGSSNGTIVWAATVFRGTANAQAIGTAVSWNYYSWRHNGIDNVWDFMGASLSIT